MEKWINDNDNVKSYVFQIWHAKETNTNLILSYD